MILLLAPLRSTDVEIARLKEEYIKVGVFVERNTEDKWEIIEKEVTRLVQPYPYIISNYPVYPWFNDVTYTNYTTTTSNLKQ